MHHEVLLNIIVLKAVILPADEAYIVGVFGNIQRRLYICHNHHRPLSQSLFSQPHFTVNMK